MRKLLIFLICLCLLFPITSVLTSDLPLISQTTWEEFSTEVREGECIAQKWIAIDFQLDVNKFSLYVTRGEFEGVVVAGICEPDPETEEPIYKHKDWLCSVDKPLGEMEGWVDFNVYCPVEEEKEYFLLFKVLEDQEPGEANAQVHGSLTNPYLHGSIWFYTRGVGWQQEENPNKDIAFEIWGTQIVNPQVQTLDAEHIEDRSAELWGQIIDDGNDDCEVRFELKDADENPIVTDDWDGSYYTDDKFCEEVDNLEWGTKYYFRAGARNDRNPEGVWGDWISFTMDLDDRIPEHHAILIAPWITPRYPHYDEWWEPEFLLLERVLKDGGFQSKNIHILYDEDATWQNIIDTLTELNDDPWDTTLVVIGTHGLPDDFKCSDKVMTHDELNDGLNELNSGGICVMLLHSWSGYAIDHLPADGRIILTNGYTSGYGYLISKMALALDEFADYSVGDENGSVSIEEAINHVEEYGGGLPDIYTDHYPSEENNNAELDMTFQKFDEGRIDQLNKKFVGSAYHEEVHQYDSPPHTVVHKIGQQFAPTEQYEKLTKVRALIDITDDPEPEVNLLVSIMEGDLDGTVKGSQEISPNDITYKSHGEIFTPILISADIDLPNDYFIKFETTGIDDPDAKYKFSPLLGNHYPEDLHIWDWTQQRWFIDDRNRDIRFATYGINDNMPPHTPKRPSCDTSFGNPEEDYYFTFNTTDLNNDKLIYQLDWDGDGNYDDEFDNDGLGYNSGQVVTVSYNWDRDDCGQKFVKVKGKDLHGEIGGWSDVWPIYINHPPYPPNIKCLFYGYKYRPSTYSFELTDPEEDDMFLKVIWDDEGETDWLGPYEHGSEIELEHQWQDNGKKTVTAIAKDEHGVESDSSSIDISIVSYNHGVSQGTHITMAPGGLSPQPVESLRVGDFISSYNPTTQEMTIAEITAVLVFTENLPDRFIFNGNLEVTTEHTLNIDQMVWLEAINAHVGQNMLENIPHTPITIPVPIISKEPTSLGAPIYNLIIQPITGEASGYFANNILVGGYD
jgi:hypothetical protein